jgi:hypothetical protein
VLLPLLLQFYRPLERAVAKRIVSCVCARARPALTGALGNCVKESVPVSPEGRNE